MVLKVDGGCPIDYPPSPSSVCVNYICSRFLGLILSRTVYCYHILKFSFWLVLKHFSLYILCCQECLLGVSGNFHILHQSIFAGISDFCQKLIIFDSVTFVLLSVVTVIPKIITTPRPFQ